MTKDNGVSVKAGSSKYKFNAYDPAEYPVFPDFAGSKNFTIPPMILQNGIEATRPFIDTDEPRPHFRGILVDITPDKTINFIGTDTKSLSLLKIKGIEAEPIKVLLPMKCVNLLSSLLEVGPEIMVVDGRICFNFLNTTVLSSQLLHGAEDFPDYEKVIPTKNLNAAVCKKGILLDTLNRLKIFASDRYSKVSLKLADNTAELALLSPESGEARESIGVAHKDAEITIYFNIDNLTIGLASIKGEEVMISYTDEKSPVVLESAETSEHKVVVMPLKGE
jgi:DNA polymerase III subunit beta